jgi:hypothetical protein
MGGRSRVESVRIHPVFKRGVELEIAGGYEELSGRYEKQRGNPQSGTRGRRPSKAETQGRQKDGWRGRKGCLVNGFSS